MLQAILLYIIIKYLAREKIWNTKLHYIKNWDGEFMGSFAFDLKSGTKDLNVLVEGMFTQQNAADFINEYQKNISRINPGEYNLVFDATNLKVSTQEVLPLLENCLQLYKQAGFKRIEVNISSSTIVKNQIKRVIEKVGLQNCEIV